MRNSRQVASALAKSGLTCLFLGFSQDLNVGQVMTHFFVSSGKQLFRERKDSDA